MNIIIQLLIYAKNKELQKEHAALTETLKQLLKMSLRMSLLSVLNKLVSRHLKNEPIINCPYNEDNNNVYVHIYNEKTIIKDKASNKYNLVFYYRFYVSFLSLNW